MKENWQYKKLGEVCDVVGGSTPKTNIEEYWHGDNYWVTPAELIGNKYQGPTKRKISDDAVKSANLQLLPVGTVLLSSRAPIGKVAITTVPMYCNQGFKNLICSKLILNEYVYWFLIKNNNFLNSLGNGATFKEISKRITENIIIPVPPLSEQERIVAELDLLSGIIEKQKQQLKELDTLAQSIFYSMFGDPISNDKNWQKEVFNKICKLSAGGDKPNDTTKFPTESNIYPIYSNSIENEGLYGYTSIPKIKEPSITIAGRGVMVGTPFIRKKPFFPIIRLIVATPIQKFNITFLYFLIRALKLEGNGGAIPQLTVPMISNLNLIFPPISLQNEFAEKIEKIEKQKEAINKSIEETQKLFDYTMDKYFG